MTASHPANERIKRVYFHWCEEARGRSIVTVGHAGRAIRSYELFTGQQSFKTFCSKQAVAFRRHLEETPSATTGEVLSIATRNATLVHLRSFFRWLSGQPGYRQSVKTIDADYLNVSRHDRTIALHRREPKAFPSCEQIVAVLRNHPVATDLDRRDRAIIAFLLLTCARVASIASLKLKHVDLEERVVHLDAREVVTKQGKTFSIWFFPVDDMVREIVIDWIGYLRDQLGFTDDDPLFPATAQIVGGKLQFTNDGLSRSPWRTTDPIRAVVKKRLVSAGQPYFHPHLFRKTIVQLGERRCLTPEAFKAWSQNMAHDAVLTTFASYGGVPAARQAEIIRGAIEDVSGSDSRAHRARTLRKIANELDGQGEPGICAASTAY